LDSSPSRRRIAAQYGGGFAMVHGTFGFFMNLMAITMTAFLLIRGTVRNSIDRAIATALPSLAVQPTSAHS